jgi:hypothetical protein
MFAPTIALSWEFWRRHRLGLAGVVGLVAAFAIAAAVEPFPATAAPVHSIWFVMGLCYVIGVFAYGFDGKLEHADSGFPARHFILPVPTWLLAGWPMLQGIAVAVLLWLGWSELVLVPSGVETPRWWIAMLAAIVAVSQALVWLPFGVPYLRLLVMIATLAALVRAPAILALAGERFAEPETQATILTAVTGGLIPISYLVAYVGVCWARRGDSPVWFRRSNSVPAGTPQRRPFGSAMGAQVWYEWRARGRGFVFSVTLLLIIFAILGAVLEHDPDRMAGMGTVLLLIPILVAASWGGVAGTSGTTSRVAGGLSAFAATRPLTNVALVRARCRAAALATIATWAVVLTILALWLIYTGGALSLRHAWDGMVNKLGTARAIGVCVVVAITPVLLTFRALVVGLWVGLTGRAWILPVQMILTGTVFMLGAYEWVRWQAEPARRDQIFDALPWIAGIAVAVKLAVSGWALAALRRRDMLDRLEAFRIVAGWTLAVAGLIALLLWLIPRDFAPAYGIALGVILILPLARLLVAPLALAWNRHR